MKKDFLRLVLASLFALSVGTAGAVFAEVAWAEPAPLATCPACGVGLTCAGSRCNCTFNANTGGYYCAPPTN